MKIRYSISLDDILEFNRYHFLFSNASRKTRLLRQWLVPMVPAITLGYFSHIEHDSLELVFGLIGSVILWVYYWKNKTAFIEKHVKKVYEEGRNDSLFGDHSFEITENSIFLTSKESETKLSVTRIERIVEYKQHIFLFVSAANALIINIDKIMEGNPAQIMDEIRSKLPNCSYQKIEADLPSTNMTK